VDIILHPHGKSKAGMLAREKGEFTENHGARWPSIPPATGHSMAGGVTKRDAAYSVYPMD
jgi:hypothetical protein